CISPLLQSHLTAQTGIPGAEIRILRSRGKKIVYSNNGCLDGVLQSTFDSWGPEPTCEICPWRDRPGQAIAHFVRFVDHGRRNVGHRR
ncbi:MAG: hypothetical protein ACXV8L_13640, partial [Ilumatobacteraceae bacterium]